MLSNLRIGKKLALGFGLVTLLLVAVGVVAYVALLRIDDGTTATLNQIEIFRNMTDATVESYEAQLGSDQHSITRDSATWAQVVTDRVKTFNEKIAAALERSIDPKVQEAAKEATAKATIFDNLDTDYAKILADLTKATAVRDDCFYKVDECVKAIAERINTMAEQNQKKEVVDGVERIFIDNDMADAINLCTGMLEVTERMQFRAVLANRAYNLEERATAVKEFGEALEAGNTNLGRVREIMKDDKTTQDLVAACTAAVGNWVKAFHVCVEFATTMDKCLADQKVAADATGKAIRQVLDNVNNRIGIVSGNTETLIAAVKMILLIVCVLAVAAACVCAWMMTRNITSGIGAAVGAMNLVAKEGDLTLEIPRVHLDRKDEVGDLAKALQGILVEFRNVEHMAQELAAGNWLTTVKVRGDLDAMNINLNAMLDQVNAALGNTAEAVEQVATGASQVAAASESLSQGATESAASIEEITASMSEIGGQTNANAQNANEANKLAQGANQSAAQGQNMMKQMIGSMEAITKNSQDIQKVVKVIDDISFQTNLLALNAAVEAARAGVHGKGFAVVAEEVRNLASRSAKAAAETTQMIDNNSRQINEGAGIVQQTAEMLDGIVEQSNQVANLLKEIANASNEQAQGVSQVSQGLHQIDAVTQQNTANAEETASVSNEMSAQAGTLQKLIGQFRIRKTMQQHSRPTNGMTVKKEAAPAKPAVPAAAKHPVSKPAPNEAVEGNDWGGEGAEMKIDLGDKSFGKY